MLGQFRNENPMPVDNLIQKVLTDMEDVRVDSEEYSRLLAYLERLYELKTKERPKPVSRDTIAIVVGNLLGVLLIVVYEHGHVMGSKALSQVIRPNIPKVTP